MLKQFYAVWEETMFQLTRFKAFPHAFRKSSDYRYYLDLQLRRTYKKRNAPLQLHTRLLVDKTAEFVDLSQCDVLCIGCRNTAEIDYFHQKGAKSVTGIDLMSVRHDILVMDMHAMTFSDNQFDLVYSAHSLEHALDVQQAIHEILRVIRPGGVCVVEVPVQYKTISLSKADITDYESLDSLHEAFAPHIHTVLFSEEQPTRSERNWHGTPIARTIFCVGARDSVSILPEAASDQSAR